MKIVMPVWTLLGLAACGSDDSQPVTPDGDAAARPSSASNINVSRTPASSEIRTPLHDRSRRGLSPCNWI